MPEQIRRVWKPTPIETMNEHGRAEAKAQRYKIESGTMPNTGQQQRDEGGDATAHDRSLSSTQRDKHVIVQPLRQRDLPSHEELRHAPGFRRMSKVGGQLYVKQQTDPASDLRIAEKIHVY